MRNAGGADNTSILADAFEAFVAARLPALRAREGAHVRRARAHRAARPCAGRPARRQDPPAALRAGAPLRDAQLRRPQRAARRSSRTSPRRVQVNGKTLGTGSGPSKKAAQQNAALAALDSLIRGITNAFKEDQGLRLQNVCRGDVARFCRRHHRRRRAQRFGQIESGRRVSLGARRDVEPQPALGQARGRDLRRQRQAQAAGPGRSLDDLRQHHAQAADRVQRGRDHAPRLSCGRERVLHQSQSGAAARHRRAADGYGAWPGIRIRSSRKGRSTRS